MSRRKKKEQKRERLERAAKKRVRLEARREERAERRQAGTRWHDDLLKGSLARRGQAWCLLGFLISMVLIFVVVLPAQLLSGRRSAPPVFYYVMLLFLPSFFGVLLFRYLEYVQKGERFGRGLPLHEPLSLPATNYRTKEIKEHTVDVLKIGPTIRDRMIGLVVLALPSVWYGLLIAFWFFVPSAYDFDENTSLLEVSLPFLLPLPFVIVGIALLALPTTFCFDRSQRRLQITNWWTRRLLPLDEITSLQLIPGQSIQRGTDDDKRRRRRLTSYSTVQLNLVMENPKYPRRNVFHDADKQAAAEMALALSRFMGVPLDDVTHLTATR